MHLYFVVIGQKHDASLTNLAAISKVKCETTGLDFYSSAGILATHFPSALMQYVWLTPQHCFEKSPPLVLVVHMCNSLSIAALWYCMEHQNHLFIPSLVLISKRYSARKFK